MATININIGKDDILNINVADTQTTTKKEDNQEDIDALCKKIGKLLSEYNHKRYEKEKTKWWYEVFYDFRENFEEFLYPKIKDMEFEEQFTFCLGYMYRRDAYYFSDEHYEFLNKIATEVFKDE